MMAGIVNLTGIVLRIPRRLRRLPFPALLAVLALGVPAAAEAQQRAELAVTVTVVRSCTVTGGSPDCGPSTGTQAGRSLAQPAPRTTTTTPPPTPPAPAPDTTSPASATPAGHTVVTIQF
jgi:hypothetical protein